MGGPLFSRAVLLGVRSGCILGRHLCHRIPQLGPSFVGGLLFSCTALPDAGSPVIRGRFMLNSPLRAASRGVAFSLPEEGPRANSWPSEGGSHHLAAAPASPTSRSTRDRRTSSRPCLARVARREIAGTTAPPGGGARRGRSTPDRSP